VIQLTPHTARSATFSFQLRRIDLCIRRYIKARKWSSQRLQIFTLYLGLGGIVACPQWASDGGGNMVEKFEGQNTVEVKKVIELESHEMGRPVDWINETESIRKAGIDLISGFNKAGERESEWEVDFCYVVRGFLSYKVPYVMGYRKSEDIVLACRTVKNFLDYVSVHQLQYRRIVATVLTARVII
jgi:hypothetical protein